MCPPSPDRCFRPDRRNCGWAENPTPSSASRRGSPTGGTGGETTWTGFAAKAGRLRELAEGATVVATWGGIALVGEDAADLERLLAARAAKGMSTEGVWTGTGAELRSFVDGLGEAGAAWFVLLPVGPSDRLDVIAAALIGR